MPAIQDIRDAAAKQVAEVTEHGRQARAEAERKRDVAERRLDKLFAGWSDGVIDDADYTIITRRDADDAVVMSLAYFQSMAETLHLLSSPANAAHLAKSIAQHKAGKAVRRDLIKA